MPKCVFKMTQRYSTISHLTDMSGHDLAALKRVCFLEAEEEEAPPVVTVAGAAALAINDLSCITKSTPPPLISRQAHYLSQ